MIMLLYRIHRLTHLAYTRCVSTLSRLSDVAPDCTSVKHGNNSCDRSITLRSCRGYVSWCSRFDSSSKYMYLPWISRLRDRYLFAASRGYMYIRQYSSSTTKKNHQNKFRSDTSLVAEILAADLLEGDTDKAENPVELDFDDLQMFLTDPSVEGIDGSDTISIDESADFLEDGDYEIAKDEMYGSRVILKPPNPNVPSSETPCPGCGALLHCQDIKKPGFIPEERFVRIPTKQLKKNYCTRCRMLSKHKAALAVNVVPEDYVKILSKIRGLRGLCLLIVDVMDFPNSLIDNLPKLVGRNRPMFILANKIDLLPRDEVGHLERTKHMIEEELKKRGFYENMDIRHIGLISAKTGYGIESLVSNLLVHWKKQGDIYLMGTTNSGKSSLFNALISSDYCKDTARDFIQRATISNWPGTTLNLLKFPIINPAPWRLAERKKRLERQTRSFDEQELRKHLFKETNDLEHATLIGNVGQTFLGTKMTAIQQQAANYAGFQSATFGYKAGATIELSSSRDHMYDNIARAAGVKEVDDKMFAQSKWCFDTPGVVQESQVINLFTQEELNMLEGEVMYYPRTLSFKPGQVMFLAGLGRIDYIEGDERVFMTVIAPKVFPLHVVEYEEADEFYKQNKESGVFQIPKGGKERSVKIPALVGREVSFKGLGTTKSSGDIQLSSLGWAAVSAEEGRTIRMRAYTPGGSGCLCRVPALLPYAVRLRGQRNRGTPFFRAPIRLKLDD